MKKKEHYQIIKNLHVTQGKLAFTLDVFGDKIAKREKYKEVHGMEAVYFYLVHKFNWLPSNVRGMSYEDIRFVLSEEMSGFVLPKEARELEDL